MPLMETLWLNLTSIVAARNNYYFLEMISTKARVWNLQFRFLRFL